MTTSLSVGNCSATLLRPPGARHDSGPARVVAVSGGIGSGKSSVTSTFARLGGHVADADAIARQILEPGQPALARVTERFGTDLIREDGTLDRAGLARRVFAGEGSAERVAALNAITHPAIARRTRPGAPPATPGHGLVPGTLQVGAQPALPHLSAHLREVVRAAAVVDPDVRDRSPFVRRDLGADPGARVLGWHSPALQALDAHVEGSIDDDDGVETLRVIAFDE